MWIVWLQACTHSPLSVPLYLVRTYTATDGNGLTHAHTGTDTHNDKSLIREKGNKIKKGNSGWEKQAELTAHQGRCTSVNVYHCQICVFCDKYVYYRPTGVFQINPLITSDEKSWRFQHSQWECIDLNIGSGAVSESIKEVVRLHLFPLLSGCFSFSVRCQFTCIQPLDALITNHLHVEVIME